MKISKPEKYIAILVDEIIQIVKTATNNLEHEQFKGMCSYTDSHEKYVRAMHKVDDIKEEILAIIKESCDKEKND